MSEEELYRFIQRQERVYGDDSYLSAGDQKEEDEIDFYLRMKGRSDKRGRR